MGPGPAGTLRGQREAGLFALQVSRSSFRYRSVAPDDSALRLRIRKVTETRIHYGYRRVQVMLRREGWRDNHKRIYRLYSEQGLSLRLKHPRRNKSAQRRQPQPHGRYLNHVWGMNVVSDALLDGRRLCQLTVIALYTWECPGDLCGLKSALNGGCRDAEHHCAQTSFTLIAKNR
ncbi:IS3 family transposase [Enterobacter roggenkampii]